MRALIVLLSGLGIACVSLQVAPKETPKRFVPADGRPAKFILSDAKSEARLSKRNIFVVFGASWCKGCSDFWESLTDRHLWPVMTRNFVVVKLSVLERGRVAENEGAQGLMVKWARGGNPAIPYYVVLNQNLGFIADSLEAPGPRLRSNLVGFTGQREIIFSRC